MTVPATARRAGPYNGNGSTTSFSFSFKTFAAGDLLVTKMDALGVETALVLNSDYSVTLNGDQDASPGGSITYPISGTALATGQKLTITSALDFEQTTDLLGGGAFNARVIEDTFDRTVVQIQQLDEELGRALKFGVSSTADPTLPLPEASSLIGWDATGSALQNIPIGDLATAVAYGTMRYQTFNGNGSTTSFALTHDPVTVGNLDVAISGVVQAPGADYSLVGQNVVFTSAPPSGALVMVRYGEALGSVPSDSNDISFQGAGTGAVTRTAQAKMRDIRDGRDYGAVADGVTNNTASVQSALNALGIYGGTVYIPDGAKFNLRSLTFPARFNLDYRADDDLSQAQLPGSTIASSERVLFSSNSSYPLDVTGGVVNEWRLTAPFHPGMVVDVRKDLGAKIAPYLGPGQTIDEPVRASWNILDEQVDTFRVIYQNFASFSNFSSTALVGWRRVVRLNGIGTAQWVSVPAENTMVTGTTSGARGFVLTVVAGYTDLLWFSGDFVAGETVSDNNETTTAVITSAVLTTTSFSPLAQGVKRGNWAIGLPADAMRDQFVVGGKIGSQRTRGTFYEEETILNPGFVWVDSYENSPPNGYEVIYDTSVAAASRRLYLTKYNSATPVAQIGGLAAHASMNDGAGSPVIRSGAFNIASVARGGSIGRYDITFTNALPTANYRILTSAQFNGFITWDLKATTGFTLFVTNASAVAQWAPFDFEVVIIGGDI